MIPEPHLGRFTHKAHHSMTMLKQPYDKDWVHTPGSKVVIDRMLSTACLNLWSIWIEDWHLALTLKSTDRPWHTSFEGTTWGLGPIRNLDKQAAWTCKMQNGPHEHAKCRKDIQAIRSKANASRHVARSALGKSNFFYAFCQVVSVAAATVIIFPSQCVVIAEICTSPNSMKMISTSWYQAGLQSLM